MPCMGPDYESYKKAADKVFAELWEKLKKEHGISEPRECLGNFRIGQSQARTSLHVALRKLFENQAGVDF